MTLGSLDQQVIITLFFIGSLVEVNYNTKITLPNSNIQATESRHKD